MLRNHGSLQEPEGHRALKPAPRGTELCQQACELPQKEVATPSSMLLWEIPWREGPGGLLSAGLPESQTQLSDQKQQQQNMLLSSTGQSDFLFMSYQNPPVPNTLEPNKRELGSFLRGREMHVLGEMSKGHRYSVCVCQTGKRETSKSRKY